MSRQRNYFQCRFVGIAACLMLAAVVLGCGGNGAPSAPAPGTGADTAREDRAAKERQRELELRKKVDSVQMPPELAREWFYDGDGTLQLKVEWQADEGRLRFATSPAKTPARAPKPAVALRTLIGFYVADSPRGPFRYVDRVLGPEMTLPQPFKLNEVKDRWYKAVVFDPDSVSPVILTQTTCVQPEVVDYRRPKAAPKPPVKPAKPAAPAAPAKPTVPAAPGNAPVPTETETKSVEPAGDKPVVVVLPLINASEKESLDRHYLGRGLCEVLREFLGQSPLVVTPDPGYVDAVASRSRVAASPSSTALSALGAALRADIVLTGSFEVKPDPSQPLGTSALTIDLSFVRVNTAAVMKSRTLSATEADAGDLGKDLAAELGKGLGVQFDVAATSRLSIAWKALNDRRGYIEKALARHDDGNHLEALAAFESVKPAEVMDAQVLSAMSETYEDRGMLPEAARLEALAARQPSFKPTPGYFDRLGRLLRSARDLKGALDILAEVRSVDPDATWRTAMDVLDGAFSTATRAADSPKQKSWPVTRAKWELQAPGVFLNPTLGGDSLVVFAGTDREVVLNFGPNVDVSRRSMLKSTYASPGLYQTCVYSAATGELKWQKSALMSAAATPVVSDGVLYGVAETGPVAVSLAKGEVLWQEKKGPLSLPATLDVTDDIGREGWKTFEVARVGKHLLVWLPRDLAVHVYETAGGKRVGTAWHNRTWGRSGQYFLKQSDGLYFLSRGGAAPVKLTDELLANPVDLTTQMRLLADPAATIQGDLLIETTRTIATSDTSRFDFLVVGTDVKKGDFAWLYPLLSKDPPVVADGRIFLYKQDISGQQSTRIQRIDVTNEETDLIDLASLEISLYEPTLALPGGKGVLIGSQAAISTDGKLLWVNRALPVTRDPQVVGRWLLVPPLLVDPATGRVVMEIDAPPGFRWDRGTFVEDGRTLVLVKAGNVKKGSESVVESRAWGYDLGAAAVEKPAETPAEKPAEAPAEKPRMTVADAQKTFFDSALAAPPDDPMTDLFEHLARRTHQDTGDPSKAAEFIESVAKTHPRNGRHAVRLVTLMKPYASMAGDYDRVLALMADLRTAYAKSPDVLAALAAGEKTLQSEKADTARAREYFESVKQETHDPLDDWGSAWPTNGIATAGHSAAPPFNKGWTAKPVRTSTQDRILPLDAAVLVWQSAARTLAAFRPDDGGKLWETSNVNNVVYYRGIVYVLADDLRAVTPATGLVLWRKRVLEESSPLKQAPLAAGLDRVFVGLPDDVVAYDWASGGEVFRQPVAGRQRLDVHGSVLVTSNREGKLVALDAKSGGRLWAKDLGTYSLYDGMVYSCQVTRESKRLDLGLAVYQATTGREMWRRHYDLPPGKRATELLPPGVTWEHLFVVCDSNLVQLKREDGEVVAKQTLAGAVTRPMAASASLVYLLGSDRKLVGYDLTTSLAGVWQLPTSGLGTVAASRGTLYLLDAGELRAYRGQKEMWSAEHMKALAAPSGAPEGAEAEGAAEIGVTKSRYISIGSMRGRKELPAKMDDKRLGEVAFLQILNVGRMADWKVMVEESMKQLSPGQRHTRTLTEPEVRALFAEMIQRREPGAAEFLKDAIRGTSRTMSLMVLDVLSSGDRAAYGPLLTRAFKESLEAKEYATAGSCAQTMGKWGHEPGVPLLVATLNDAKAPDSVRVACARALAEFEGPEVLRALLKTAQEDSRTSLPALCIELLMRQGDEGVKAAAALLASSGSSETARINAATALGPTRAPDAVAALLTALKALKGGYPTKVRGAAAVALSPAAKDSDDVLNALVEVMTDAKADPVLRNACLNALGFSENPKAIPHLIAAMGDLSVDNRKFSGAGAFQLLQRLTKESRIGPYPEQWQAWWQKNKERLGVKGP